jgi:hypothetical protein
VRARGHKPRTRRSGEPNFDLAWASGDRLVVAQVESLTAETEELRLRLGLGQIGRFRRQLTGDLGTPQAVLAVERSPTLNRTYVKGTVKVERAATLRAAAVHVVGNVQAENARNVVVRDGSRIGGSVQVKQGGAATVASSFVNADIQSDANARELTASDNVVGGSIQVFQNTGGVTIADNRVDGNLQCEENRPAPVGGGNVVQGNKEDQCARL